MLLHLILGLLRSGEPQHGYQLVTQHRGLTGASVSPGNVYRALSKLASRRLVRALAESVGGDSRRIPYQITDHGRELFDQWLLSPSKHGEELEVWLLFAARVPTDVRDRVLERVRDVLWSQCKALERAREDAMTKDGTARKRYNPLVVLLSRRLKQATAELEFLNELRADLSSDSFPSGSSEVEGAARERGDRTAKHPKRSSR